MRNVRCHLQFALISGDDLDNILHNNEASSSSSATTVTKGSATIAEEHDQDRASMNCEAKKRREKRNGRKKSFPLVILSRLAFDFRTAVKTVRKNFPVSSYSSSDDEDDEENFFDADETIE